MERGAAPDLACCILVLLLLLLLSLPQRCCWCGASMEPSSWASSSPVSPHQCGKRAQFYCCSVCCCDVTCCFLLLQCSLWLCCYNVAENSHVYGILALPCAHIPFCPPPVVCPHSPSLHPVFIAWAKFPQKMSQGGLVPDQIVAPAKFIATAGAIDFNCECLEALSCASAGSRGWWPAGNTHMCACAPPNRPHVALSRYIQHPCREAQYTHV